MIFLGVASLLALLAGVGFLIAHAWLAVGACVLVVIALFVVVFRHTALEEKLTEAELPSRIGGLSNLIMNIKKDEPQPTRPTFSPGIAAPIGGETAGRVGEFDAMRKRMEEAKAPTSSVLGIAQQHVNLALQGKKVEQYEQQIEQLKRMKTADDQMKQLEFEIARRDMARQLALEADYIRIEIACAHPELFLEIGQSDDRQLSLPATRPQQRPQAQLPAQSTEQDLDQLAADQILARVMQPGEKPKRQ